MLTEILLDDKGGFDNQGTNGARRLPPIRLMLTLLRKKYHIVVFRNDHSTSRHLWLRGWVVPAFFGMFLLLGASMFALWAQGQDEEESVIKEVHGKERQGTTRDGLLMQAASTRDIASRVDRILLLNTKLSIMFGNATDEDFLRASSLRHEYSEDRLRNVALFTPRQMGRYLNRLLVEMNDALYLEEARQQDIIVTVRHQQAAIKDIPSIWPVRGRFTSAFGRRKHPILRRWLMHKGIDIAAPSGTPIVAPASGTVISARRYRGYGKTVELEHRPGLRTRYAHMSKIEVKVGDEVNRGDIIGRVGSTGRSTGNHLHYEVHVRGKVVNPLIYILD